MACAKIRQKKQPESPKTSPLKSSNFSSDSDEELPSKTSPCQSIVASIDSEIQGSSNESHRIEMLKVKTFREIQNDLLLTNYAAEKSIENLR